MTKGREWAPDAKAAVSAGPSVLQDFLRVRPPSRSDQVFRDLLQHIHKHHSQDQKNADRLYDVVFEALGPVPGTYRYQRQFEDNARDARDRRKCPRVDQNLSAYEVFRFSMSDSDWKFAYTSQNRPIPAHSPLTQLIWEKAKEELYCQGAISACAEFGLDELLHKILAKLQESHLGPAGQEEQLEILFQIPPNGPYTALGAAIANRKTKCFDTLYLYVDGAAEHIFRSRNVINGANGEVRLVHWTLKQIQARQSMSGTSDVLEEEEELLRRIIKVEPRLLAQHDAQGLTPYALALKIQASIRRGEGTSEYTGLGTIIKNAIFEQLKDPEDWRRALYNRSDPGKEVSLDLSDFNYKSHYFEHFVNDLEGFENQLKSRGKSWKFESTILYLILPNLRTEREDQSLAKFLRWLRGKEVSRIVKLKLPDSSGRYSHDFVYQNVLRLFEIDEFDWVRLDVNIDGFGNEYAWTSWLKMIRLFPSNTNAGASADASTSDRMAHVRSMHVYSFGQFLTNAVAFKAPRQLRCLEDIRTIHLNLVSEPPDEAERSDYEQQQEKAIKYRNNIYEEVQGGAVTFSKVERLLSWQEFTLQLRLNIPEEALGFKLIKDLAPCRAFLSTFLNLRKPPMGSSCNRRTQHCQRVFREQRVKIAIIDNGADQMGTTISNNIVRGMSFVRSGLEAKSILPWYTPADPHGTQMADLIRNVNPWCELFPLRVASLHRDVDLQAAIEAIDWALENNVDIVSISWIIKTRVSQAIEFRAAVARATTARVLVICATADVGAHSSSDTWPANFDNVIAISASNAYGLPMPWSHRDVHAMLDGDQIKAHGPDYMRLDENACESGSSVATALASGLASLCLFLARMANEDGTGEKFKDRLVMLALIRSMQAGDSDRVIELSGFFDSTFQPAVGFQRGDKDPPAGLNKFLWTNFADMHSSDPDRRRAVRVRRRSMSARRGTN